ncbi:hypothetical protein FNH22_11765 [Fulvivirga sp. M361]|uniref:hypothetical protein n=1 Tax=Fulvivirga sp. M361 TaxID=2594266 RepID=UPI00117BD0C6|nr:hypothetical protein [Fulvivirga sp. M361]TRX59194.1 hypothetical protein FNH22_11765 [Fulvivirga sp. M361]
MVQLDSAKQKVTQFGAIFTAKKAESERTRKRNDELITLAKKYLEIVPICPVHPMEGDTALQELERIASVGVKIIKIHPYAQNFDVTDDKVLNYAGRLEN